MRTFVVIPLTDDTESFEEALGGFSTVYRDYGPRVFFVKYGGTAKELSEKVGFSLQRGAKAGVVMRVDEFHGFARTDLWGWLDQE